MFCKEIRYVSWSLSLGIPFIFICIYITTKRNFTKIGVGEVKIREQEDEKKGRKEVRYKMIIKLLSKGIPNISLYIKKVKILVSPESQTPRPHIRVIILGAIF